MSLDEWIRDVSARSPAPAVVDRECSDALEAMVERCETGFEAWAVFAARGVIPVRWLD
jgi:hypothetical protein